MALFLSLFRHIAKEVEAVITEMFKYLIVFTSCSVYVLNILTLHQNEATGNAPAAIKDRRYFFLFKLIF